MRNFAKNCTCLILTWIHFKTLWQKLPFSIITILREMINCLKFDSSKKLVNTKISTTRRKSSSCQKSENWPKIKKHLHYVYFKRSRCDVQQFFLGQLLFLGTFTVHKKVKIRINRSQILSCFTSINVFFDFFPTLYWSKRTLIEVKQDNI